ncbi:hypothetical protein KI387_043816 [Taxus chinensis]|uniref:Nodulation signaling pathway 2-like protein n=1 Tax=Taxus chinensis TaxID=29808 RepID=A0AA38KMT3_TAXCH|nr:hypothetical protein KI387_043816 [Taxus chinensis]
MEDIIMQEWGGRVFENWQDGHVNDIDFSDAEPFVLDLSNTQWPCWSEELLLEDNELQYSSSTPEFLSAPEDEFMQIMDTDESMGKLDRCRSDGQGLSGREEVASYDSISINFESSGSSSIDSDGFIPCSTDSEEYKGLRLVHLLTACAQAISDGAYDLVEIILCRLRELVSPTGSSMQRVAYYLSQSLQQQIPHTSAGGSDMLKPWYNTNKDPNYLGAFSLLNQVYPYIKIAHFTANQAILEAIPAQTQKVIHIIDFDIVEGMQWPPLMEALKNENYKIGHLKITAVKWHDDDPGPSSSLCNDTGRRLSEYASSLGIPFSFQETELESVGNSRGSNEIVIANCMWELPHMCERSKKQLLEFVQGTRHLNPAILTVGSGPRGIDDQEKHSFMDRFSQCLRNLCAVCDSSEAGLPEQYGLARAMVERLFLGPMMCRPINYIVNEDEGGLIKVADIPVKCGFSERDMSSKNLMYAKYMVTGSDAGRCYTVERVNGHDLVLKWNSTSLTSVSTWNANAI